MVGQCQGSYQSEGLSGEEMYDRATMEAYIIMYRPHIKAGLV